MEEEIREDNKPFIMESDVGWLNIPPFEVCSICGEHVEINNDDVESSMELHVQSHKSILKINIECDKQLKEFIVDSINEKNQCSINTYSDYKTNDDTNVFFSLQTHTNKSAGGDVFSDDDRVSTASNTSKHSERKINYSKIEQNSYCGQTSLLDRLFDIMPVGLKSHRSFISENENNIFCKMCNMKIVPVFSVSEHLKTKIHEDNTINFLKQKLPNNLHGMMEFISFYGSNLCCNLCRTQINLSSNNPHETIVNIMIHNASSDHMDKKTNSKLSWNADDARLILKTFASLNSVIKDNKHLIECDMQPTFKCKLCNKPIVYDKNEYELLKNFIDHLNSIDHNRLLKSRSILDSFNTSHLSANGEHNFIATKHGICCTVCNCVITEGLEQLISHAKGSNYNTNANNPQNVEPSYSIENVNSKVPSPRLNGGLSAGNEMFNMKVSPSEIVMQEPVADQIVNLKSLLNSLPEQLKSTTCIVENEEGHLSCLVCQCVIPLSAFNIEMHLTGNKHKNKQNLLEIDQVIKKLPPHLQKNKIYIKSYANEFNRLICTLCNVKVPIHVKCLQEHLEGDNHNDLVGQTKLVHEKVKHKQFPFEDALLNNILKTELALKNHMKYLAVKDDNYICNLCKNIILREYDEELFKSNLFQHFGGTHHKGNVIKLVDNILGKLKFSDETIKKNKTYLKRRDFQIHCTLCDCAMSPSTDEECLKKMLSSHLTGGRHMNNKAKTSFTTPSGACFGAVVNSNNSIDKYFEVLPVEFWDDKIYMKKGSVDGYLSCKLCSCTINPYFLKEHLESERHIKERQSL